MNIDIRKIDDDPCLPLHELDCSAELYENGKIDTERLTTEMKNSILNFIKKAHDAGYSIKINSAFRSKSYQFHFYELARKLESIDESKEEECPDAIAKLRKEQSRHSIQKGRNGRYIVARPSCAPHSNGIAIDISIYQNKKLVQSGGSYDSSLSYYTGGVLDSIAYECGLVRPVNGDKVHFELKTWRQK